MSLFENVICPVSFIQIDKNVSRVTVFMNVVLLTLYLLTGSPVFVIVVAIDYAIRAFGQAKYSPLRFAAVKITGAVGLPEKCVDQAPKLFASRVGFLFAFAGALLFPVSAAASLTVAGILLVFAFLDSIFDFCVGCITYTYIVLPFYQRIGRR